MDSFLKKQLDEFESALTVIRSGYVCVSIKPQPKQSVRFFRGRAHPDKKKEKYVKELASQIGSQYNGPRMGGLVRLTVLYSFPWRNADKAFMQLKWILMSQSPDVDNMFKPFADSMQGICFENDSQIVEIRGRKIRSDYVCIAARLDEVMAAR